MRRIKPQNIPHKKPYLTNDLYLTNDSCYNPTVKIVADALAIHIHNCTNFDFLPLTYKTLSELTGGKIFYMNLSNPLYEISSLCKMNNLPLVSSIVINGKSFHPGDKFFECFFPNLPEDEWDQKFVECLKEVYECNEWDQFFKIFK